MGRLAGSGSLGSGEVGADIPLGGGLFIFPYFTISSTCDPSNVSYSSRAEAINSTLARFSSRIFLARS